MRDGIRFSSTQRGEMIFFKMDNAPDLVDGHTPPTTPAKASKHARPGTGARGLGYAGRPARTMACLRSIW